MAIFATHVAQAQLTITAADFADAGDTILVEVDTLGMDEFVSFEGLGSAPWDFSTFGVDLQDTIFVVSPTETTFGDSFPNANLAVQDEELGLLYMEKTDSGVSLLFEVNDTGIGIPEEKIENIRKYEKIAGKCGKLYHFCGVQTSDLKKKNAANVVIFQKSQKNQI